MKSILKVAIPVSALRACSTRGSELCFPQSKVMSVVETENCSPQIGPKGGFGK